MSKEDNAGVVSHDIVWCDMSCEHASFPKEGAVDGSGTCRTFLALWCAQLGSYVTKNSPCAARYGSRRPKTAW